MSVGGDGKDLVRTLLWLLKPELDRDTFTPNHMQVVNANPIAQVKVSEVARCPGWEGKKNLEQIQGWAKL